MYSVNVLTRSMLTAEYGDLTLLLTYVVFFTQILYAPLSASATRFYVIAKENDELIKYSNAIKYYSFVFLSLSILISLVVLFLLFFLGRYDLFQDLFLLVILAILNGLNMVLTSILFAQRKRFLLAIVQGLDSWLKISLAILLISVFGAFSISVIIGYLFSAGLMFVLQIYLLKDFFCQKFFVRDKLWEKNIYKYMAPFMAWGLFTWLLIVSDKWALSFFSTSAIVGQYNALFQIGYVPITILIGFAIQLLTPIYFDKAGDGRDVKRNNSTKGLSSRIVTVVFILTGISFLIAVFTHNVIFRYFFTNIEYVSVSYLFPWLILSGGIFACGQALTLEMMSRMHMSSLASVKIGTSIFGISLNILFVYLFNIRGVVAASLMFSICYFCWVYYRIRLSVKKA